HPRSVAVGDLNRDGNPDLATANESTCTVSILLGNSTGGFGPATNYAVYAAVLSDVVGDFNRDGNPDLAVAIAYSRVSVLLNTCSPPGVTPTNTPDVTPTPTATAPTRTHTPTR